MESEKKYVLSGFNYLIALQSIARLVLNILQFPTGQYAIAHYYIYYTQVKYISQNLGLFSL